MRENKFRAWDSDNKYMLSLADVMYKNEYVTIQNGNTLRSEFKTIILMQFTGLLDKNGKEIYEGDIIQATYPSMLEPLMRKRGERYEIIFRLGAFKAFDLATKNGDIEDSFLHEKSFGRAHLEGYEVIGNIYENKDLLK